MLINDPSTLCEDLILHNSIQEKMTWRRLNPGDDDVKVKWNKKTRNKSKAANDWMSVRENVMEK